MKAIIKKCEIVGVSLEDNERDALNLLKRYSDGFDCTGIYCNDCCFYDPGLAYLNFNCAWLRLKNCCWSILDNSMVVEND